MAVLAALVAGFHGLIVIPTLFIAPLVFLRRSRPVLEAWFLICAIPTGYFFLADENCPLTVWEQQLRVAAGQTSYSGGFFQHYLPQLGLRVPLDMVFDPIIAVVLFGSALVFGRIIYRWYQRRQARRTGFYV